jgi:hypothetical protein
MMDVTTSFSDSVLDADVEDSEFVVVGSVEDVFDETLADVRFDCADVRVRLTSAKERSLSVVMVVSSVVVRVVVLYSSGSD